MVPITASDLKKIIEESNYIVFFGGAGVSTDSGLKDFRGKDGLFKDKFYGLSPEQILSESFFRNNPKLFYQYYKEIFLSQNPKPNFNHYWLKKLEDSGKLKSIITQNIDGLHQLAGSSNVIELHGSILRNYTVKTHQLIKGYDIILESDDIPYYNGEMVKPDVVLYEGRLDEDLILSAIDHIKKCDLLIVAGTSLSVYPAAGLIRYFSGKYLVGINEQEIDVDYFIKGGLKDVLSKIEF